MSIFQIPGLGSLIDWGSRKLFRVSLQERNDRALEIADGLRSLRRQLDIVRAAGVAVENQLSGSGVEGAVALVGAPANLVERLSQYDPPSVSITNVPDPVARTFRELELTVNRARQTCKTIIATTLSRQREKNVRAAIEALLLDLRRDADAAELTISEAREKLPGWARRRAMDP